MTTDAGGLLLREVGGQLRLIDRLAACFTDHRQPGRIENSVRELIAQRVIGLALGYEDLTITISYAPTRCWPCWQARRSLPEQIGGGSKTGGKRAPARAP